MVTGKAANHGARSMIVALLVTLAAPILAYAAVRNAALDAAGNAADPSAMLPPHSTLPTLKATMRAARHPENPLPANALAVARRSAVSLPLAYEPFYIAARVAEQDGRYVRATILMEEARRRRPNATSVRVALLGYYSLADAYQKAIDEADFAMRINGQSMGLILPGFAKLIALDVKARQAIAFALAKNPPWRDAFLRAATTAKMKPEDAQALVADIRRLRPGSTPAAEEEFLVRTLAEAGRYREARALARRDRPATGTGGNVVVDPRFAGEPATAPFGWTLRSGQDGTAEIAKGAAGARSMLEVDYFGDTELTLAEQTLAAAPGRYRLSTTIAGFSSAPDVRLTWEMLCLPSRRSLGRIELQPLTERPTRHETMVTIPGDCEGQSLALTGRPGDISRTLGAQISEIALVPVGAAGRAR